MLTIPKSTTIYPVVILVHGSGPNDKDETIGPNKVFRDLAHGLAHRNIATLRYDKRTYIYGAQSSPQGKSIDLDTEVLDDVASAIKIAVDSLHISSVFVLGHSLGGMLAPLIAQENKGVKGIIMMAANARPLEKLIHDQFYYLLSQGGITEAERVQLDTLQRQLENLQSLRRGENIGAATLPLNLPVSYWESLIAYDQVATACDLLVPILILQGGRDYQVTTKDFEMWKKGLKNHENVGFEFFKILNHLFLEGEGPSLPAEYQKKANIPDYVLDTISRWVMENK